MTKIQLDNCIIGSGQPTFIIAEAGVNHNGDLDIAKRLVDAAVFGGADAVKFQTFKTENLITLDAPKAQYHIDTTGSDQEQSWYELLKTQELDREMHVELIAYCVDPGIRFLSTPYDYDSVDLLDELGVDLFKVASTDANNHPLLAHMASKGRGIILSTAMCDLAEVSESVAVIRDGGVTELVVMQCTGSYPAPLIEANLAAMQQIAKVCNVSVGYSDHVEGATAAIAAIALGACVYEKHITIDKSLPGPDHRASMEPEEFKALVTCLRATRSALGDGVKRVMPCEKDNRSKLRKSVLASRDISVGEDLNESNLTIKRAGGRGLSPDKYFQLIGQKALCDISKNVPIDASLLSTSANAHKS